MIEKQGQPKLSPEARFIGQCLREDWDSGKNKLHSASGVVCDWKRVVEASRFHGVAPWMLFQLDKLHDSSSVPPETLQEIKAAAFKDIAKVTRLRVALNEVLKSLNERGLPVIVLKGAALVSLAYDNHALRPTEDIDLLCIEDDFASIYNLLLSLGYEHDERDTARDNCMPLETRFEHHFRHTDGLVTIELHVDSLKLGVRPKHSASIWQRARSIEIGGVPALTLSLEDQVVMLSVHLHRHGFNRLIWFKDIDLLIRRYENEIDWSLVVAEAKQEGAESSLWYTLTMLEKMLATPIPKIAPSTLKPPFIKRWAYSRIWPESAVLNLKSQTRRRAVQFNVAESLRGVVPSLILMNRRREKLGIIMRHILPSRLTTK